MVYERVGELLSLVGQRRWVCLYHQGTLVFEGKTSRRRTLVGTRAGRLRHVQPPQEEEGLVLLEEEELVSKALTTWIWMTTTPAEEDKGTWTPCSPSSVDSSFGNGNVYQTPASKNRPPLLTGRELPRACKSLQVRVRALDHLNQRDATPAGVQGPRPQGTCAFVQGGGARDLCKQGEIPGLPPDTQCRLVSAGLR